MRPETSAPWVSGVLGARDVARTAASIADAQEPGGAIPWSAGQHADVWNHVEAAMALLVGGQVEAAEHAYAWVPPRQRTDGSFPMSVVGDDVVDDRAESNMSAYLAVGVWHHWLVRREVGFVHEYWPVVRDALDYVVGQQLPFGGIAWAQEWVGEPAERRPGPTDERALLSGSASIYQALRAGVALAELLGDPQVEWELAGGRLGHALRHHRDRFLDKSAFAMDWYYPVLGGAVRGDAGLAMIDARWEDFVVPGLGSRCVSTNPWVTAAETSELVLALDALGDRRRALTLLADVQHLRDPSGAYWTGWVFGDDVVWPQEHTTYTAAAVVLAVDALGEHHGHATPGSGIMRGTSLAEHFAGLALECGCPSDGARVSR